MTTKELFLAADLLDHAAELFDGSEDLSPEYFANFSASEQTKLREAYHAYTDSEDRSENPSDIPDFEWASFLADRLRGFAITHQSFLDDPPKLD